MSNIKNVSSKLLKAIAQVGGKVPKTGYNSFSKYYYITESDINTAILPALIDNGLLLTTSVEQVTEVPSDKENKNRFATVRLVHEIVDTESGEVLQFKSAGTAADTLDKAIFKATTGAFKYFAMKLFLISGDDSDPENDGGVKPTSPEVKKTEPKKGHFEKKTEETKVETKPKSSGFPSKSSGFPTKSTGFSSTPKAETTEEDPAF